MTAPPSRARGRGPGAACQATCQGVDRGSGAVGVPGVRAGHSVLAGDLARYPSCSGCDTFRLLPLAFLSSAFMTPALMPGRMRRIADFGPVNCGLLAGRSAMATEPDREGSRGALPQWARGTARGAPDVAGNGPAPSPQRPRAPSPPPPVQRERTTRGVRGLPVRTVKSPLGWRGGRSAGARGGQCGRDETRSWKVRAAAVSR